MPGRAARSLPAEDDAAHIAPPVAPCCIGDGFVVLRAVEAFDLPNIRLDSGVLELKNGAHHERRPELPVVHLGIAAD